MRAARTRDHQRGFTLVELMISLVLFTLVVAAMLSVAVSMARGYREQRMIIAAESSSRAATEILAEALRGASPGVPLAALQHVNTCEAGAFSILNSTTGPDEITVAFASGSVVTSSRTSYGLGTTAMTVTNATQLAAGDTVLITNLEQGHIATVATVNTGTGAISLLGQSCGSLALPAGGYPPGSLVIRVLQATFRVGVLDGIPTLFMDPDANGPEVAEPLAEGIEDMQIAVGVDANADGSLTELGAGANDDEWAFNVNGETQPAGRVRGVRITLVARAVKGAAGLASYLRPAAEDRSASVAFDAFRRRSLTTMIEIRNIGGSP